MLVLYFFRNLQLIVPPYFHMLLLNFEPLSPAALALVAASDASVRKQLKSENFFENKAKNVMVPAAGPSPQFFNPPRDHYILGWYYARRRVYLH